VYEFQNNLALHPVKEWDQRGKSYQAYPARSGMYIIVHHLIIIIFDISFRLVSKRKQSHFIDVNSVGQQMSVD
jgi:hypothetical protein